MLKRVVTDKDGNVVEDLELELSKDVKTNSQNEKKQQDKKHPKKSQDSIK